MAQSEKKKHVAEYELGHTLGEGAFGKVKLGTNIFTGQKVAVKVISGDRARSQKDKLQLERERSILLRMNHPNIVNLIKVVDDEANNKCYLILEYVNGGELFDYIISYGRISEKDARRFMRQIISAVEYCHSLLIVHRDLKPENLLLDEGLNIKISDFGLSNVMTPGKKFSTFCGSLHYACPEILKGKEYLGPGVDIWAMGIILYCLVVGRQPWDGSDASAIINSILDDGLEIPDGISDGCVNLILSMLRVNEADRISLAKMRFHPWVNEGYDEPPPCYLAVPEPVHAQDIDVQIIEQLKTMHFIKEENVEDLTKAIILGLKENQAVCIYHLLLKQQQEKLKSERAAFSQRTFVKKSPDATRDRRSASVTNLGSTRQAVQRQPAPHVPSLPVDKARSATVSSARPIPISAPVSPTHHNGANANANATGTSPKQSSSTSTSPTRRDRKDSDSLEALDGDEKSSSADALSPRIKKSLHSSAAKKKRIIVSRAESFRIGGSTKARSDSLKSGEEPEELKERKEKEKQEKPLDPDGEADANPVNPVNPVNKHVRKYSRSERPLMSLDSLKGKNRSPSKEKDEIKSRVSRTSSASVFSSNKHSVLNSNIFVAPKNEPVEEKKDGLSDEKNVPSPFQTKLVSTLSTESLMVEIEAMLAKNSILFSKKGFLFKCKCYDGVTECQFSIEVIRKDDNRRGLRIKRTGGSWFVYQNIYSVMVDDMDSSLIVNQ